MPGGGRTFGPRPKDHRTDLPRQQRRAALASALSLRASENAVSVVDSFGLTEAKTSKVAATLAALGLKAKRTLLIVGEHDEMLWKSCRNIHNLTTTIADQLNAYELLACESVVLTSAALQRMKEVYAR
jgi:large subunit ribosomal protein L4